MKNITFNENGTVTIDNVTYAAQPSCGPTRTPEPAKPKLPESWEELGQIGGCAIDLSSGILGATSYGTRANNRNIFASKCYAKAALAFAQLSQIYERWKSIEFPEWKADWVNEDQYKYCPGFTSPRNDVDDFPQFFPFPTYELRDKFWTRPAIAKLLREFYMVEDEQ